MKYILSGIIFVGIACSPGLTQTERDDILMHARKLEDCREVGRINHSYNAYEQCKADAGIK